MYLDTINNGKKKTEKSENKSSSYMWKESEVNINIKDLNFLITVVLNMPNASIILFINL